MSATTPGTVSETSATTPPTPPVAKHEGRFQKIKKLTIRAIIRWQMFRWIVTILMIVYIAVILHEYFKTCEEEVARRDKLEFVHEVLFGRQGVLLYIFILSIFTILLLIWFPLIRHFWDNRHVLGGIAAGDPRI